MSMVEGPQVAGGAGEDLGWNLQQARLPRQVRRPDIPASTALATDEDQ